jgi:hypothetical protein
MAKDDKKGNASMEEWWDSDERKQQKYPLKN